MPPEVLLKIFCYLPAHGMLSFSLASKYFLDLFYQNLCDLFHSYPPEGEAENRGAEISRFLNQNKTVVKQALHKVGNLSKTLPHASNPKALFYFFIRYIFSRSMPGKSDLFLLLQYIHQGTPLTLRQCINIGLFPQEENASQQHSAHLESRLNRHLLPAQRNFILSQSLAILLQEPKTDWRSFIQIHEDALQEGIVGALTTPGRVNDVEHMLNSKAFLEAHRYAWEVRHQSPLIWLLDKIIETHVPGQTQEQSVEHLHWRGWLKKCLEAGIKIHPVEEKKLKRACIYEVIQKIGNDEELIELLVRAGASVDASQFGQAQGPGPLHLVLEKSYINLLEKLLAYGADPNKVASSIPIDGPRRNFTELFRSGGAGSALHAAIRYDHPLSVIELLLKHGADPNTVDASGTSVVNFALRRSNRLELVLYLLKNGADPMRLIGSRYSGLTAVLYLMFSKESRYSLEEKLKIFKSLLPEGALLNQQDEYGDTLLHHACRQTGNLKFIPLLLDAGADPNLQNKEGKSPLHYLIQKEAGGALHQRINFDSDAGIGDSVIALLQKGADPNLFDRYGNTPLFLLLREYFYDVKWIRVLLEYGAKPDLEYTDKSGRKRYLSALAILFEHQHFSADNDRQTALIPLFIKAGLNPNQKNDAGSTPLHLAAERGNISAVKCLLEKGANPDLLDGQGNSVLDFIFLSFYRHNLSSVEVIDMINSLSQQRAPQLKTENWFWLFNGFIQPGILRETIQIAFDIASALLAKGFNPNVVDEKGENVLHKLKGNSQFFDTFSRPVITFLVGKGVKRSLKNKEGYTPYDLAVRDERSGKIQNILRP